MAGSLRILSNGKLVETPKTFSKENPATLEEIARVPETDLETAEACVNLASEVQTKFATGTTVEERKELIVQCRTILEGAKDEICKLITVEQGKPLWGSEFEFGFTISCMTLGIEKLSLTPKIIKETDDQIVQVVKRPIGIVCAITPWNFPLFIGVAKMVKAIITGNAFIWKPSPFTPLTALRLGELFAPVFSQFSGIFNVLTASDTPEWNLGNFLVKHPLIQKVSFTGSVATGQKILSNSANDLTRVTLELGGNDAAIVCEDADVDETVKGIFNGFTFNTGQVCCAVKRAYVHSTVYDEFVQKICRECDSSVDSVGNGQTEGCKIGPLNNLKQLEIVKALVSDAEKAGATVHCPKKETDLNGYYYYPTIVSNVTDGVRIVDEEQFGPVLPIVKVDSVEEAISKANNSKFGLGASVWSADRVKAAEIASKLQAGTVWTNEHLALLPDCPFGGFKTSGIGREHDWAEMDIDAFTETQTLFLKK